MTDGAGGVPAPPERRAVVHYNDVHFANIPSFTKCLSKDRKQARSIYDRFVSDMQEMPVGTLHHSCSGTNEPLRRAMVAYLIARYTTTMHLGYPKFLKSLQHYGGAEVLATPGLVTQPRPGRGDRAVINLLVLPDRVLKDLYIGIDVDHRRPERPKVERAERGLPSKAKRQKAAPQGPAEAFMPVEEASVWACCDACGKWRRLFNTTEDEIPDVWKCTDHPDELTCAVPEETMDDCEQWDEVVRGSSALPSSQEPSASASANASASVSDDDDYEADDLGAPLPLPVAALPPPAPPVRLTPSPTGACTDGDNGDNGDDGDDGDDGFDGSDDDDF